MHMRMGGGGVEETKLISETYSSLLELSINLSVCMCVGRGSEIWIRSHTNPACEAV